MDPVPWRQAVDDPFSILSLGDHLEQSADFSETLVIDFGTPEAGPGIRATWNSEIEGASRDHHVAGVPGASRTPLPAAGSRTSRCPTSPHPWSAAG
ncbi:MULTISPECIES: hypothetical protein [unclassified Streptomyces]|uniref:Uncharacterized protein n=1 Tax=Streptomyces sp. NBC_00180 TaxID=2903632 RepID=A0AAU1I2N4_9ACTN|nr:hypothetical protein OG331_34530 [Streptomyces sp. NBC_01017]